MFAEEVLAYAKKRYNDGGWDVIVECWGTKQINELLEECYGDETEAWRLMHFFANAWVFHILKPNELRMYRSESKIETPSIEDYGSHYPHIRMKRSLAV